jgi:hypothetical protein
MIIAFFTDSNDGPSTTIELGLVAVRPLGSKIC